MREDRVGVLSERIDMLREWWGLYVHDGVTFPPGAVAEMTATLADLKSLADDYEQLLVAAGEVCRIAAGGKKKQGMLARRAAIDEALAAKGLSGTIVPASALLTENHLAQGNVFLHPRSWRMKRPSPKGVAS